MLLGTGMQGNEKQSGMTVAGGALLISGFSSHLCRLAVDRCHRNIEATKNRKRNCLLLADKIRYRDKNHFVKLRFIPRYVRFSGLGNIIQMVGKP